MSIILGLNCYHADSSACIIKNNKLLAAAEEERFNRVKHFAGYPKSSIEFCLSYSNINPAEITDVAINANPYSNILPKLFYVLKNPSFLTKRFSEHVQRNRLKLSIRDELKKNSIQNFKLHRVDHHIAHLASAYYATNFERSLSISVDGFGDFTSLNVSLIEDNKIKKIQEIKFPFSLGLFYEAITQFLGFNKFGDEYKVMGLAAFGKPVFYDIIKKELFNNSINIKELNLNYFNHHKENFQYRFQGTPSQSEIFNISFEKVIGFKKRKKNEEINDNHKNLASSCQKIFEVILENIIQKFSNSLKCDNVVISGGCAMNSVANGNFVSKKIVKNIFVPYAPGDGGGSIGAAAHVSFKIYNRKPENISNPYLGPKFSNEYIENIFRKFNLLDNNNFVIKKYDNDSTFYKDLATTLADGKVVGNFQGRMEFGSRALGNRSILCDPRINNIDQYLNEKIKRREKFRPFAPSILDNYIDDWFEHNQKSNYMSYVLNIRKDKQQFIPAVTHFNGTGRLQTVTSNLNEKYFKIISYFHKITGVPILLNTSFNENEPIVCTPEDAIDCFLRTNIDTLSIESFLVSRKL